MNDLILIFSFCVFSIISSSAQVILTGDSPVITLDPNDTSIQNADAWGGDLCLFQGDPSQPAISQGLCFTVTDADTPTNMLSATVSSSNINVVPVLVEYLKITYTPSSTNPNEAKINLMINPFAPGLSDIVISIKDPDKNTANYYIDLTAKSCRPVLCINQDNIDAVAPPNNVFQASNRIKTEGIPSTSANGPIIQANDDIVFNAGNSIDLNPGFEVMLNGLFLAEIKDCDN